MYWFGMWKYGRFRIVEIRVESDFVKLKVISKLFLAVKITFFNNWCQIYYSSIKVLVVTISFAIKTHIDINHKTWWPNEIDEIDS